MDSETLVLAAAVVALAACVRLRSRREPFVGPIRKATITWFSSYPARDSAEWSDYSGGQYEGMFALTGGMKMKKPWVARHNIVAVHSADFRAWAGKLVRVRWNGRTIDAQVRDMCADGDTPGDKMCTANKRWGGNGFLVDLEEHTARRLGFLRTGKASGSIQMVDMRARPPWGAFLHGAARDYKAVKGRDYT